MFAQELFRYACASALALVADVSVLVIGVDVLQMHYLLAAAIGFAVGVSVAYALSVRWVFAYRSQPSARQELLIFVTVGLAGLLMNEVVLYTTVDGLSWDYRPAKAISAACVFLFNFGARKAFLFTRFRPSTLEPAP